MSTNAFGLVNEKSSCLWTPNLNYTALSSLNVSASIHRFLDSLVVTGLFESVFRFVEFYLILLSREIKGEQERERERGNGIEKGEQERRM
jgi:Arc/MetJ-type ribon-helix-helix transcriptional regulator